MKNKTYLENKEIKNSVNKNLAIEIENIPPMSKKASKYEAKIIRKNNKPHKAVLEQPEILPN
ncbi:MAG: hypothetical protein RR201_03015, partial [Malacoplasma sp.]